MTPALLFSISCPTCGRMFDVLGTAVPTARESKATLKCSGCHQTWAVMVDLVPVLDPRSVVRKRARAAA